MIAVIDYGAGNLRSISRALETVGADVVVTSDPDVVRSADAVVLPGVGHAGHSIQTLAELGMPDAIHEVVEQGKPFLGICVGMQVMFEEQEEGDTKGFGLLPGKVRSIQGPVKVPHIGWNKARVARTSPLGNDGDEDYFYFVHSFVAEPDDPNDVVATTDYGEEFASVVVRANVWGTQFHPEKSGTAGLRLIRAFVEQVDQSANQAPAETKA
jgi:imidazole glycerol-phosphate synthase subunit HisH